MRRHQNSRLALVQERHVAHLVLCKAVLAIRVVPASQGLRNTRVGLQKTVTGGRSRAHKHECASRESGTSAFRFLHVSRCTLSPCAAQLTATYSLEHIDLPPLAIRLPSHLAIQRGAPPLQGEQQRRQSSGCRATGGGRAVCSAKRGRHLCVAARLDSHPPWSGWSLRHPPAQRVLSTGPAGGLGRRFSSAAALSGGGGGKRRKQAPPAPAAAPRLYPAAEAQAQLGRHVRLGGRLALLLDSRPGQRRGLLFAQSCCRHDALRGGEAAESKGRAWLNLILSWRALVNIVAQA